MYWDREHRENPEKWWVTDPRWLGRLTPEEYDELFSDRHGFSNQRGTCRCSTPAGR